MAEPTNNKVNMTTEKLKAEHPEAYAACVAIGVAQEKARVEAWAHFIEVDAKGVAEGIKSGNSISQAQTIEMMEKKFSAAALKKLGDESAEPTNTSADDEKDKMKKNAEANRKEFWENFGNYTNKK